MNKYYLLNTLRSDLKFMKNDKELATAKHISKEVLINVVDNFENTKLNKNQSFHTFYKLNFSCTFFVDKHDSFVVKGDDEMEKPGKYHIIAPGPRTFYVLTHKQFQKYLLTFLPYSDCMQTFSLGFLHFLYINLDRKWKKHIIEEMKRWKL